MRACLFTCNMPRQNLLPPQRLICHIHVLFICDKFNCVNNLINQARTARPKERKGVEIRGAPAARRAGYAGCRRRQSNPSQSLAISAWQRSGWHTVQSGFPNGNMCLRRGLCGLVQESRERKEEDIAHVEYRNEQTSRRPLARGYHGVSCSFPHNSNRLHPCHHPRRVSVFRVQGCSHGLVPGWRLQVVPAALRGPTVPYRVLETTEGRPNRLL